MSDWPECGERRKMDRDWIERDRILSELHSDMKHLVEWSKTHDQLDNNRFKFIGDRVSSIEKMAYLGIGGLAVLDIFMKLIY